MPHITYKNTYSDKPTHIVTKAVVHCNGKHMQVNALWDTGASHTHITEDVINAFELTSHGEINTLSHTGESISQKYKIDVELSNLIIVNDIIALSTPNIIYKGDEVGLLVGMDIIRLGNFCIDNTGENTIFTFTLLSDEIDNDILIETNLF